MQIVDQQQAGLPQFIAVNGSGMPLSFYFAYSVVGTGWHGDATESSPRNRFTLCQFDAFSKLLRGLTQIGEVQARSCSVGE